MVAAQWLLEAERQMDEAAIYTIHGFCQRMLATNAFESGVLFEQVLIQDEYELKNVSALIFGAGTVIPFLMMLPMR